MTKAKQVFISHATADARFAHRLADDLQRLGVQVWIAPESIRPGESWVDAIERGLEESSHTVIVLTPEALKSRWVKKETEVAIAQERRGRIQVIPLDVEPCAMPLLLSTYQMVSFRRDYNAGFSQLADILGVHVTPPYPPAPFWQKVLERAQALGVLVVRRVVGWAQALEALVTRVPGWAWAAGALVVLAAIAIAFISLRPVLGGTVLFTSDRDGKREIYRLTSTGEVQKVTHTPGSGESWSPVSASGGSVLFTSNRDGKREIYRLTGTGEIARVTSTPGSGESWSPVPASGGTVLFTSDRDGKREIYRLTGTREIARVTSTPGSGESWSPVSASGGTVLFTSNRDGKREIYRLTGTGEVVQVTSTPGKGESWSPASELGGAILFTSNRDGKREVYRLTGTGEVVQVTSTPGKGESWLPDW